MNKASRYTLVTILTVLVILLIVILYIGIGGKDFGRKKATLQLSEEYELSEISKINIQTKSSEIYVKQSEDEKVHVNIYASDDEKGTSLLDDGTLNVSLKSGISFCFMCIGKSYQRKIELELPKTYSGDIAVDTKSGDVELDSYKDASLTLSAKSGDVIIKDIDSADINVTSGDIEITNINKLSIKATSGDIDVNNINRSAHIKVTSGDVEIKNFNINADSKIQATSGDVKVKNLSDAFVNTSVKSGNVRVNGSNRNALYELEIKVTSGDIKVN